ncbi:MAG TPA: hypothetical protein VI457_12675 [Methylococcaceae bacterium]|nr:hypothetical protein [Methylococcaceae bacterium]
MKTFVSVLIAALSIWAGETKPNPALPEGAVSLLGTVFQDCRLEWSSVGALFGTGAEDIAASFYCPSDVRKDSEGEAGPYALALLKRDSADQFRLAYSTRGLFSYIAPEIKRGSLSLHSSSVAIETAASYDYQFRYDGTHLILIGMELDVIYTGSEMPPPKGVEYHVSANYLTNKYTDTRIGPYMQEIKELKELPIEDFNFEMYGF